MKEIAEVVLGLPVSKTFHYRIPDKMWDSIQIGMRVLVPFKGRRVTGFTIELLDHPPKGVEEKLLEIEDLLDAAPLIDPTMLRFYRWVSGYYLYPLGEVIKTGLPPGLHLKSEWILSLTQDQMRRLRQTERDPIQEKVLKEIGKCGKISLKKLLKIFPGELSRSKLFSWKRQGLLNIDVGIESREVKPKFEKIIQYKEGERTPKLPRKQQEILKLVEERG